ncbi:MAG: nucleotidyltransferase [Candidatus Sedimenticola sp. (ex Thyasira tokunagai)]
MPIPESQFETWSHQGSIQQSSSTYKTIKSALETYDSPYCGKNYKVFLQGSYGNNTNIYSESDVDIVIRLDSCFQHDLSELSEAQQSAFKSSHSDATYTHVNFKSDVLSVLSRKYNSDVDAGEKAIMIAANGNRRKADVIAAIQYRRYHRFVSEQDQSYDEGICFYTNSGDKIANYPRQHSENLTKKHQNTSMRFKPMARILKNLRGRTITEGLLGKGAAPSYYIEGLLYNVPDDKFINNKKDSFVNAVNWIQDADKSKFVCANEQYYLLRDDSLVTWRTEKCEAFLAAAVDLWSQW